MADGDLLPWAELGRRFIEPLAVAADSPAAAEALLVELGYIAPADVTALEELGGGIGMVAGAIDALLEALDAEDEEAALVALAELAVGLGRVFAGFDGVLTRLQADFSGSGLLTDTDIVGELPRKLADHLVVRLLEDYHPTLFAALLLIGVIDVEDVEDAPTEFHAEYRRRRVDWEGIPNLLSDPIGSLKANLRDGDEFLYERLLFFLRALAVSRGLVASYDVPDGDVLETVNDGTDLTARDDYDELTMLRFPIVRDPAVQLGLDLYPRLDAATGKATGLGAALRLGGEIEIPLGDDWRIVLTVGAALTDSLGILIEQDGTPRFVDKVLTGDPADLADAVQFGVKIAIEPTENRASGPIVSLGLPLGARFELGSGDLAIGVEKLKDLRIFAEADLVGGVFQFGTGSADGFISSVVPLDAVRAEFTLGVGVSNVAGLYFKGSSGLELRLPLHLALGPIQLDHVTLGATFKEDSLPLTAATGLSIKLGPIAGAIEDIGVRATLVPKADRSGNLGPLDAQFAFKPPNGVGLAIDAGVVSGGGYLYFDTEREEYAGALELSVAGWLRLTAIGLVTTRMPDGSHGFSLLIIITAEFGSSGIQLGYGFALIGVGGLLGLNRTMRLQPLMEGVRTGAVNGIMFPRDVVANAPRIISDLRTIFPPKEGTFLIGPMAKLGWGGGIITLSLGVIIEIPGNVAILGVLQLALPTEDEPVLILRVNFAGAIEFDRKRLYFFAALFESRLLFMTIEGEMAVLAAFGDDANLVLSVGGFHPDFDPPPLPVPTPKRISLNILNETSAKLRAETYFAVTTNTAQMGARAELLLGMSEFGIEGSIGFDALLQFVPLHFVVDISASFSVKVFGVGAFSVRVKVKLEGPSPWRVKGTGSISLLFFDISVEFEKTWGSLLDVVLEPIAVLARVLEELAKGESWTAHLPPGANLLVSLRPLDTAQDALVLHPVGTLRVSQRAVPLGLTVAKVGEQRPSDVRKLTMGVAGGGLAKSADALESFAPAQYQDFDDATKLSKPAYERYPGGIELSVDGDQLASGAVVKRIVRYELSTIDTNYRRFVRRFHTFPVSVFTHLLHGASIARSPLSQHAGTELRPFADAVSVAGESYVVAFAADNTAVGGAAVFASEAMAREEMAARVAADPRLDGALHVVPAFEMAA
jgi:hypothetical protein